MTYSPLELADLHVDVLYERDKTGLLIQTRSGTVAPPVFHLVRTVDGNRWLISSTLAADRCAKLEEELSSEPVVCVFDEMEFRAPIVSTLRGLTDQNASAAYRGPAFRFPDPLPRVHEPAELLRDPSRAKSVPKLSWIRAAMTAEHPLAVARNSLGEIVSVCHSARATANGAEAGVETAPGYRGRGLAGSVVLAWAAALLAEGRIPLYSTQWTNHASRSVARKLGLIPYGEDYHCP